MARKPLLLALEDGELGDDLIAGDEAAVAVASADDMAEVTDAEIAGGEDVAAIESMVLSIEDAVENVEEAEALAETVGEQAGIDVETGEPIEGATADGLDESAAVIAEEAFQNIYKRLGISQSSVMPSMESFRSANSRRSATRIGLESVMDKVKDVWAKIIEAIKSLWARIAAFFKKFMDANRSLEKAAKSMKERVKSNKTRVAKVDDFEHSGLTAMFPQGGKLDSSSVKNVLAAHTNMINAGGKSAQTIASLVTAATKLEVSKGDNNASLFAEVKKSVNDCGSWMTGASFSVPGTNDDEVTVKGTQGFVDGKVVEVTAVVDERAGDDETPKFSFSYTFVEAEGVNTDNKKVEVATANEMTSLCTDVESFAKANGKFVTEMEKAKKEADKLVSAIDKMIKGVAAGEAEDRMLKGTRKATTFLRQVVGSLPIKVGSFGLAMANRNVRAGRGALAYVAASLSKY